MASLSLHRDYILCMAARDHPASGEAVLVTGGAADHAVILYDIDTAGAITCRHQMSGHRCVDISTVSTVSTYLQRVGDLRGAECGLQPCDHGQQGLPRQHLGRGDRPTAQASR